MDEPGAGWFAGRGLRTFSRCDWHDFQRRIPRQHDDCEQANPSTGRFGRQRAVFRGVVELCGSKLGTRSIWAAVRDDQLLAGPIDNELRHATCRSVSERRGLDWRLDIAAGSGRYAFNADLHEQFGLGQWDVFGIVL